MRKFDIFSLCLFIALWTAAMTLVGCDEEKFKAEHPVEAAALEVAENIAEGEVDSLLHLPAGTAHSAVDAVEKELEAPQAPK